MTRRPSNHPAVRRVDPTEFVDATTRMVIDEVQRVPDLLLAIKETVDTDTARGHGHARTQLVIAELADTCPIQVPSGVPAPA